MAFILNRFGCIIIYDVMTQKHQGFCKNEKVIEKYDLICAKTGRGGDLNQKIIARQPYIENVLNHQLHGCLHPRSAVSSAVCHSTVLDSDDDAVLEVTGFQPPD